MVQRVVIDSTADSPFRVSASGVDADDAEFATLIFDGNQSPLRLRVIGYAAVAGISFNAWTGGQNTNEGTAVVVDSTPTGTFNIWISNYTQQTGFLKMPFHNNLITDGGGSALCRSGANTYLVPFSHEVGPPGAPTDPGPTQWVNYAIMRNFF